MSGNRLIAALVVSLMVPAGFAAAQEDGMPPVKEFVSAPAHHGMSYELASRYGPEAVPDLVAILQDREAATSWDGVVWLLGIIGTKEAETALIDFQEGRFEGVVDGETLQALLLVGPALGFRAHDPETGAFAYLREGLDPELISRRDLKWTASGWKEGTLPILLAKLSVNGLGLAGNEAGRDVLEEMREKMPDGQPQLWRYVEPNVSEAIVLSRRIEEVGYAEALSDEQPRTPRQQ